MKVGRQFQGFALKEQPQHDALLRFDGNKLGIPGVPQNRLLPTLSKQSFAELMAKKSPLAKPKSKVALFAGCMVNYAYPQLGLDCYDVLMANQIQMVTFKGEACCGLPAIMSGGTKDAAKMAKENICLFSSDEYDYLLFVCPSCATTVKEEWEKLLADCRDERLLAQYKTIQRKVMDINDYLVNVLHIHPPILAEAVSVTWHDPCHLGRGLQITKEPRQLLQQIGANLQEMKEPNACCGFGGSFSLFHYDVSRSVNDEKIQDIAQTNAQYVATGCPGCLMHLKDGLYRHHSPQQATHIVSLLAKAYRQGGTAQ
jgi:glycolate oxidase iron-sulfur subunit